MGPICFVNSNRRLQPAGAREESLQQQMVQDKLQEASYAGGDLRHAKELVRRKELRRRDICLFDGECVWHPQQLEQELANGLWLLLRMPPGQLLDHLPDRCDHLEEGTSCHV